MKNKKWNEVLFEFFIISFGLLVVFNSAAQNKDKEGYLSISTGIDVRNGLVGSDPTNGKPKLDVIYQFSMVGKNIEVNLGYENFNAIGFEKYTVGVGYHFPLYGRIGNWEIKTVLIPSIEPTIIGRWGDVWQCSSSHLSIAGNVAFRWFFTDKIGVELLTNFLPRVDLSARYPEVNKTIPIIASNYFKIIYKI